MKENSFISAMFEEIKSKISAIEKKLEKDDTPPGHPGPATKKDEKGKAITAEELLRLVQKTIIYSTQKELQHAIPQLQNSKNEILDGINELRISLKNLKCSRKTIKKDFGISNLKLWKISSIVASVLLLFCIIELKIENLRLADNDLKFRYIYLNQGIDSTGLHNLETIFHVSRDKELIKNIRQAVVECELEAKQDLASKNINRNTEPDSSQE